MFSILKDIQKYEINIGKEVEVLTKNLPILIIKSVIKHPFKNKAAYKFTNTNDIILCEECNITNTEIRDLKLKYFKQYIGKTIYYSNENIGTYLITEDIPEVNNLFRVKNVIIEDITGKIVFTFENTELQQEAKNFKIFKDAYCHYTDFKWAKNFTVEWLEVFNKFQKVANDILCYDKYQNKTQFKVQGFSVTQYKNKKLYMIPIVFDTETLKYSICLVKKQLTYAQRRESMMVIKDRTFYFYLENKVFEFNEYSSEDSLKILSENIKWIIKNYTLQQTLEKDLKHKSLKKEKRTKI